MNKIKFAEYCQLKSKENFHETIAECFSEIANHNISDDDLMEHIIIPALQGDYATSEQLMEGMFDKVKSWFGGNKGNDYGPGQVPLAARPHPNPYGFRDRPNRMTSRSDMLANNREADAENQRRDAHNQGVQRSELDQAAGQKLLAVKEKVGETVRQVRDWLNKIVSNNDPERSPKYAGAPVWKKDVITQFLQELEDWGNRWKPKLDYGKYYQSADYSGVKSSLAAPRPKTPHYGNADTMGHYDFNQPKGDSERTGETDAQNRFKANARRIST